MKELTRIIRRKRREFSMHQNGKTGNGLPFRLKFLINSIIKKIDFHFVRRPLVLKFVIEKVGNFSIIICFMLFAEIEIVIDANITQ